MIMIEPCKQLQLLLFVLVLKNLNLLTYEITSQVNCIYAVLNCYPILISIPLGRLFIAVGMVVHT